ncbi:hypothetical protein TNCV_277591 [Trichonephila clavipes]|uniref:Uncharacterized protein n=1 Tax=Trichonephila clavipes TaxID=2585209 RepID=A0A8X6SDC9_TRICX|nr:hypothetical protein TNCV_277591 [Trichonephila clavipes]
MTSSLILQRTLMVRGGDFYTSCTAYVIHSSRRHLSPRQCSSTTRSFNNIFKNMTYEYTCDLPGHQIPLTSRVCLGRAWRATADIPEYW